MNIPEEWPTDEMTQAGFAALPEGFNKIGYDALQTAFKAMLAAAPTPPKHAELHDLEIRGIALDCGFKLKPQADGSEDLNPYVYRFAREILSTIPKAEDVEALRQRLTLPAQDEPVAMADPSEISGIRWFKEVEDWTRLYTRTQSDKLRQAAENVVRIFFYSDPDKDDGIGFEAHMLNLRAALEGK
jgi:hypothetical protein